MNLENIRKVRDVIASLEKTPTRFSMIDWADFIDEDYTYEFEDKIPLTAIREGSCSTCACIGGWAVASLTKEVGVNYLSRAAELFDLTRDEAIRLFLPWEHEASRDYLIGNPQKAGPKEATKVLTHILETNEIDWNAAWR